LDDNHSCKGHTPREHRQGTVGALADESCCIISEYPHGLRLFIDGIQPNNALHGCPADDISEAIFSYEGSRKS
jgi:hypothetical protein